MRKGKDMSGKRKSKRRTLVLAVALLLSAAACSVSPKLEPPPVTLAPRLEEARILAARAAYVPLKRAWRIYADLSVDPRSRAAAALPFLKTSLLLALREKDLGFDSRTYLPRAVRLLDENPGLASFRPYAGIVGLLPPRTRGVVSGLDPLFSSPEIRKKIEALEPELKARAATDEFAAFFWTAWSSSGDRWAPTYEDPSAYLKIFPDSLLLRYRTALAAPGRTELFREILEREPEFGEVHFHLGEAALAEGRLLSAEAEFLQAAAAVPESPQCHILLAAIYLATEEWDKSLAASGRTLEILPDYRDAVLGQAICLSALGRLDESNVRLRRLLELGYWLIGESHYWLARNAHAAGREADALAHADEAKGRLPTSSEVFSLAGSIALALGEIGRAEKDFREALHYSASNTESLLGLAILTGRRGAWTEAADFYEKAASAMESQAEALEKKIEEIAASPLAADRKAKMKARRAAQLERARTEAAEAWLGAAAARLNSGDRSGAARAAEKAARHPATRVRAEELLARLRG